MNAGGSNPGTARAELPVEALLEHLRPCLWQLLEAAPGCGFSSCIESKQRGIFLMTLILYFALPLIRFLVTQLLLEISTPPYDMPGAGQLSSRQSHVLLNLPVPHKVKWALVPGAGVGAS